MTRYTRATGPSVPPREVLLLLLGMLLAVPFAMEMQGQGFRPVEWQSYLGGARDDAAHDIAYSAIDTTVVVCGATQSMVFLGQNPVSDVGDAFVAKFTTEGELRWVRRFPQCMLAAVSVAHDGGIVCAGASYGGAYVSADAYQPRHAGGEDGYVLRLEPDGTPTWATYVGSRSNEAFLDVMASALDTLQWNYDTYILCGRTSGMGRLPDAVAPVQRDYAGGTSDGLMVRMGENGRVFVMTYCGGSGNDELYALGQNAQRVFTCGRSTSERLTGWLPKQPLAPIHDILAHDAIVAGLDPYTFWPIWWTYHGGGGSDVAYDVSVLQVMNDRQRMESHVRIVGRSSSSDLVCGTDATLPEPYSGGTAECGDVLVALFNDYAVTTGQLDVRLECALIGSDPDAHPQGDEMAVAAEGSYMLVLSDGTFTNDSVNGFRSAGVDAYVGDYREGRLRKGRYYGGTDAEGPPLDVHSLVKEYGLGGMAVDDRGAMYVVGQSASTDLPVGPRPGAQVAAGGGVDGYVVKFGCDRSLLRLLAPDSVLCSSGTLHLTLQGTYDSLRWSTGETAVSILADTAGLYQVIAIRTGGCEDTLEQRIYAAAGGNTDVRMEAGATTAAIGAQVQLVVRIGDAEPIAMLPLRWRAVVSVPASVLYPVDATLTSMIAGTRKILTLAGERSLEQDTLAVIACAVALGDTDRVQVTLESFAWQECPDTAARGSVTLDITGICRAGGAARLVEPAAGGTVVVSPHVVASPSGIDIRFGERGQHGIALHNVAGAAVCNADILIHMVDDVRHVAIPDLEPGIYSLVVVGPSNVYATTLLVLP